MIAHILTKLQEYKTSIESKGHIVYAIALKGSQNYNLSDEESDIDANAILIPTLSDLRHNKSIKYKFDTGEVMCHNIYSFADIVANYSCHDRDKKSRYVFHWLHLLPAGKSQQHNQYITSIEICRYTLTLIYKQNTPKNLIFGVFYVLL